ncbi:MAG: DUF6206 family protein [Desulfobacterales bacterium]|jgi:hypothetical protein|nr:DUF6206 family protein [Desulfobacterales bacterium]
MMHVDPFLLEKFENRLDPAFPEKSGMPPTILGYGEISTTFSIEDMPGVAFKRMPPFDSSDQIKDYKTALDRYHSLLTDQCQIPVSQYGFYEVTNRFGEQILYVAQPLLPKASIGNFILKNGGFSEMAVMVSRVTRHLLSVWQWNQDNNPHESIALDGQISNWSFQFTDNRDCHVVYFDITTPMFRINGRDQLDTEIFLKSCPSMLVWLVRWQFLQDVLDRYYDTRSVLIDLAANFHKEGRADLIEDAVSVINAKIDEHGLTGRIQPLTRAEIDAYYKNDAFIWSLFLALRRMDRAIKTRILRKRYNFILPGKIKR